MHRTHRVRLGLVAVASLLVLLVVIGPGRSQPPGFPSRPGFPNFPRPPIGPQPPIAPQPPAMPQPPVVPQPNFPEPNFPQPPVMPQPNIPQPGVGGGGGGGGGRMVYQWTCGRCGRVLGTGPNPPATAFCGVCRVTNVIPGGGADGPRSGTYRGSAPVDPDRPVSTTKVMLIALGVLVLLGVGAAGVVVALMLKNKSKKRRIRRRRPRYDDDF